MALRRPDLALAFGLLNLLLLAGRIRIEGRALRTMAAPTGVSPSA